MEKGRKRRYTYHLKKKILTWNPEKEEKIKKEERYTHRYKLDTYPETLKKKKKKKKHTYLNWLILTWNPVKGSILTGMPNCAAAHI